MGGVAQETAINYKPPTFAKMWYADVADQCQASADFLTEFVTMFFLTQVMSMCHAREPGMVRRLEDLGVICILKS